jgi:ribulose-phosphate 3-epimerase
VHRADAQDQPAGIRIANGLYNWGQIRLNKKPFAPELETLGAANNLNQQEIHLQAHLEIDNPEQFLVDFRDRLPETVILQLDTLRNPADTIAFAAQSTKYVGIGISPNTSVECVTPFIRQIDLLLILGVTPGFGGQKMQNGTPDRVAQARRFLDRLGLCIPIAVDGGVGLENRQALVQAGADIFVVGTSLFTSCSMADTVRRLIGNLIDESQ